MALTSAAADDFNLVRNRNSNRQVSPELFWSLVDEETRKEVGRKYEYDLKMFGYNATAYFDDICLQ